MDLPAVRILLVDDDDVDREAVVRGLKKMKVSNPVTIAEDGMSALEALRGEGEYTKLQRPNIVLLDLNMPRMNGIEFLQELRRDARFKDTVVFVLTTSDSERDKVAAYDLNVAGYILKSNVGDDFIKLVTMLDSYWRIVELPHEKVI